MSNLINKLESKQNLSFDESKNLFNEIMEGKYNEDNIIKILEALSVKGETKDELAGGIFVLRGLLGISGTGTTATPTKASPLTAIWWIRLI